MTDPIFFDNDCLSSFLWVNQENIIIQLYKNRLMLPQQVYDEMNRVPYLKRKVDMLITYKHISVVQIELGTPEAELYIKLISRPDAGFKLIDKGEAAAISLAKNRDGILGSNNLKDISTYVDLYGLKHITTGDILKEALAVKLISEAKGNQIWEKMLNKQRMLPTRTFSDYLIVSS
jgi:predicted nucleic acid-binding protein